MGKKISFSWETKHPDDWTKKDINNYNNCKISQEDINVFIAKIKEEFKGNDIILGGTNSPLSGADFAVIYGLDFWKKISEKKYKILFIYYDPLTLQENKKSEIETYKSYYKDCAKEFLIITK